MVEAVWLLPAGPGEAALLMRNGATMGDILGSFRNISSSGLPWWPLELMAATDRWCLAVWGKRRCEVLCA